MKKVFFVLLALMVLLSGCGGEPAKPLKVEPLKPIEVKNPKIEAIQDAKLKAIAKEIDANLKKNDAVAEFESIKFSKNGLGEKDFSTTSVIVSLHCQKSKVLTRKRIFDALSYTFKSIYKDANIKDATIRVYDAENDELCVLALDKKTEKQITWDQADKMKDWNKIADLFGEYPKMRRL